MTPPTTPVQIAKISKVPEAENSANPAEAAFSTSNADKLPTVCGSDARESGSAVTDSGDIQGIGGKRGRKKGQRKEKGAEATRKSQKIAEKKNSLQ